MVSNPAHPVPTLRQPGAHPIPGQAASPGPLAHAPTAAAQAAPTVPANLLPNRTPAQLLAVARQGLAEAARTRPDGLRYAAAHLAALRAAAAILAARARPAAAGRFEMTTAIRASTRPSRTASMID